jgi:hypothetical protein
MLLDLVSDDLFCFPCLSASFAAFTPSKTSVGFGRFGKFVTRKSSISSKLLATMSPTNVNEVGCVDCNSSKKCEKCGPVCHCGCGPSCYCRQLCTCASKVGSSSSAEEMKCPIHG